jgi:hypothetical protein
MLDDVTVGEPVDARLLGHVDRCAGEWRQTADNMNFLRTLRIFFGDFQLKFILGSDGQNPIFHKVGNILGNLEFEFT